VHAVEALRGRVGETLALVGDRGAASRRPAARSSTSLPGGRHPRRRTFDHRPGHGALLGPALDPDDLPGPMPRSTRA
jgi:hypothetical protein